MQVGAQQTNRIYIPDFSEPLRSTAPITQAPTAPPSSESLPVQHVDGLQEGDASLRYHRSENTSLKIRTQEGDVVRIRFQTRESAKAELSHEVGDGVESTELKLSTRSSSIRATWQCFSLNDIHLLLNRKRVGNLFSGTSSCDRLH